MKLMKRVVVLGLMLALSGVLGCGSKEVVIKTPESQNPKVQKGVEEIMKRRQQQQQQMAPDPQRARPQSQ